MSPINQTFTEWRQRSAMKDCKYLKSFARRPDWQESYSFPRRPSVKPMSAEGRWRRRSVHCWASLAGASEASGQRAAWIYCPCQAGASRTSQFRFGCVRTSLHFVQTLANTLRYMGKLNGFQQSISTGSKHLIHFRFSSRFFLLSNEIWNKRSFVSVYNKVLT